LLYSDLNDLGNLINNKLREKRVNRVKNTKMIFKMSSKAAGVHNKTRKNTSKNTTKNSRNGKTFSFKRRPKRRKFRNPFFLSVK